MEGLSHYIEFSKSFPSYSCSSSNSALKYVSYQASSLALCEQKWLRILFRGLLHINAARKVAVVHLMWWWQLFSKIFLYPYLLRTCLKFILMLESLGRLSKSPGCLLNWYSFGPRRVSSLDLSPPLFPDAIIYSRASPVICSSLDASSLVNSA